MQKYSHFSKEIGKFFLKMIFFDLRKNFDFEKNFPLFLRKLPFFSGFFPLWMHPATMGTIWRKIVIFSKNLEISSQNDHVYSNCWSSADLSKNYHFEKFSSIFWENDKISRIFSSVVYSLHFGQFILILSVQLLTNTRVRMWLKWVWKGLSMALNQPVRVYRVSEES